MRVLCFTVDICRREPYSVIIFLFLLSDHDVRRAYPEDITPLEFSDQ